MRWLALTLMWIATCAHSLSLGPASNFNLVVLEDMQGQSSDVEGRLAVGGNLALIHYAVGMELKDAADFTDTLIVGGHLDFTFGRVYHGNAISPSATLTQVGFYAQDPSSPTGAYLPKTPTLNFTALAQDLRNRSLSWAQLPANDQIRLEGDSLSWRLYLAGSDPHLNVFALTSEQLAGADAFYLDAPLSSTVLINVDGIIAELSGFGFYRKVEGGWLRVPDNSPTLRHTGRLTQKVLFNFFAAESLTMHAIGVKGSVLAPWAEVVFYGGHIDGQLIAKSLRGLPDQPTGQVNLYPFIPEPGVVWLLALPLAWLIIRARKTKPQVDRR